MGEGESEELVSTDSAVAIEVGGRRATTLQNLVCEFSVVGPETGNRDGGDGGGCGDEGDRGEVGEDLIVTEIWHRKRRRGR